MCIHNESDIGYQNTNSSIFVENNIICKYMVEIQEFLENQEIAWMKECVGIFFHCIFGQKIEKSAN